MRILASGRSSINTDELTLEKAIDICRAAEATHHHMHLMVNAKAASAVHSVDRDDKAGRDHHRLKSRIADNDEGDSCSNCSRQHEPKRCPAHGEKCSSCRRRVHRHVSGTVRQILREGFPIKSSSWQIMAYRKIASDIVDPDGILLHNDSTVNT